MTDAGTKPHEDAEESEYFYVFHYDTGAVVQKSDLEEELFLWLQECAADFIENYNPADWGVGAEDGLVETFGKIRWAAKKKI